MLDYLASSDRGPFESRLRGRVQTQPKIGAREIISASILHRDIRARDHSDGGFQADQGAMQLSSPRRRDQETDVR